MHHMLRFEVLRWNLKKLVCENCGSSDFSYQDNIYTCKRAEQNMFLQMMETILSITIILISMIRCIIQMIMKKSLLRPKEGA